MDALPIDHELSLTCLMVALLDPQRSACARIVQHEFKRKVFTASTVDITMQGMFQNLGKGTSSSGSASGNHTSLSMQNEFRCLFMINAVNRVTSKNYYLSFNELV